MYTIFGSSGFIGSAVCENLKKTNQKIYLTDRNEKLYGKNLGKVIYCIGLTADAKTKPYETVEAHITKLLRIIQHNEIESLTYCSSTRLYIHTDETDENAIINVNVNDQFELFNLTKLVAESLLINTVKNCKIVRLSNVIGEDYYSGNFITSIIKDALVNSQIILRTGPKSCKDYILLEDAVNLIIKIAKDGKQKIYNVASGLNTSNEDILHEIKRLTGCQIKYEKDVDNIIFSPIKIEKIKSEFNYTPSILMVDYLETLINKFRLNIKANDIKFK